MRPLDNKPLGVCRVNVLGSVCVCACVRAGGCACARAAHVRTYWHIRSVVAEYRRKDRYHFPDVEILKTLFGLLQCQEMALTRYVSCDAVTRRAGRTHNRSLLSRYSTEEYVWCTQLFQKLSLGIALADSNRPESLVTPALEVAWRVDLQRRIARNTQRQSSEAKKKEGSCETQTTYT